MEAFLSRYRNLTLLVAVIFGQLILLAWQVKAKQDVRVVRVWAVTAVTPLARFLEEMRSGTSRFFRDAFALSTMQEENRKLRKELDTAKLEMNQLRNELAMADRVQALASFQKSSPLKFVGARVISSAPGVGSKVVYIDRGTTSGVERNMAVITPDGVVGKVVASYPGAAQVKLINDAEMATGVVSQKNRVIAVVRGNGEAKLPVDYVRPWEKLEVGELLFTSGEDRVFPKGMPVGKVVSVSKGGTYQEIFMEPAGLRERLEEVLVVTEGTHQAIPALTMAAPAGEIKLLAPPPLEATENTKFEPAGDRTKTDADRIREKYKQLESWNGGALGTSGRIPNFNLTPAPAPPTAGVPAPNAGAPAETAPLKPPVPR
ncbi:MAG: rod shape-determining protein MreC [Bryobacteraceae bacterium]|nr:rod shape-determining protein MreC [Bryobacteraceae bacterium]